MSPDTTEFLFRRAYEDELESWLRRRFAYLTMACAGVAVAWMLTGLAAAFAGPPQAVLGRIVLVGAQAAAGLWIVGFFYLRRDRHVDREDLLGAASQMILALGIVWLAARLLGAWLGHDAATGTLFAIFVWHFTACLLLPWSPKDSLRPVLPLLAVWVGHTLVAAEGHLVMRLVMVAFSPGVLVPGLVICRWRLRSHSRRFRSTMLGRHVRNLRQEVTRARTIHDTLFPCVSHPAASIESSGRPGRPCGVDPASCRVGYNDGFVELTYSYCPMRDLGGDYLHLHTSPNGIVTLTLLDVTGHGLAAALTVNRISGELERLHAEHADLGPGGLLERLNRYVHLTLARHTIFATAVCLRIDPYAGELTWASAGHPPAMLRGANRNVRDLQSTGLLLGALGDDDYVADEHTVELAPGDVIVAFTDGAYEARDRDGQSLGVARLRHLLRDDASADGWPGTLHAAVERHRGGRAEDDVLIAALAFTGYRPQLGTRRNALVA